MDGTGRVNVRTVVLVLIVLIGIMAVASVVVGPRFPSRFPPMPRISEFEVIGQRLSLCLEQGRAIMTVFYNLPGTNDGLAELVAIYATPEDLDAGRPFVALTFKPDERGALLFIYVDRNRDGRAEIVTDDVYDERLGESPCDILPEEK